MIPFSTPRLWVDEFTSDYSSKPGNVKLYNEIVGILSPAVTLSLPRGWSNIKTQEEAKTWIGIRMAESRVLTVSEKQNQHCIGFVFLYDMGSKEQKITYRFGYLLAESVWGKGLGTELIKGLVRACKEADNIASLSGGVERNNLASVRVLEKIGFSVSTLDAESEDTVFYEYQF